MIDGLNAWKVVDCHPNQRAFLCIPPAPILVRAGTVANASMILSLLPEALPCSAWYLTILQWLPTAKWTVQISSYTLRCSPETLSQFSSTVLHYPENWTSVFPGEMLCFSASALRLMQFLSLWYVFGHLISHDWDLTNSSESGWNATSPEKWSSILPTGSNFPFLRHL